MLIHPDADPHNSQYADSNVVVFVSSLWGKREAYLPQVRTIREPEKSVSWKLEYSVVCRNMGQRPVKLQMTTACRIVAESMDNSDTEDGHTSDSSGANDALNNKQDVI